MQPNSSRLLYLLLFLHILTPLFCQDKNKLKEYVNSEFDVVVGLNAQYSNHDFYAKDYYKSITDVCSEDRIEELKDSLEILKDDIYLLRIGSLYLRMNKKAKASFFLNQALVKFQNELNVDPRNVKALEQLYGTHMALGNFQQALDFNDLLLLEKPMDEELFLARPIIWQNLGKYDMALKESDSLTALFPDKPISHFMKFINLVTLDFQKLGMCANIQDAKLKWKNLQYQYDEIFSLVEEQADNEPMQMMILYSKTMLLLYQGLMPILFTPTGDYDIVFQINENDSLTLESLESEFMKLSIMDSIENKYPIHYSLGLTKILKNQRDEAINQFKKSIEVRDTTRMNLENNLETSYSNIIAICMMLKDEKGATEWLQKKIDNKAAVDPKAEDYIMQARFYLKEERYSKGQELLNQALKINAFAYEAYVDLANVKMLQDDYAEAEKLLDKCYEINPNYPQMINSFILCSLFKGDKSTALYLSNKLLDYNPENSFPLKIKADFF